MTRTLNAITAVAASPKKNKKQQTPSSKPTITLPASLLAGSSLSSMIPTKSKPVTSSVVASPSKFNSPSTSAPSLNNTSSVAGQQNKQQFFSCKPGSEPVPSKPLDSQNNNRKNPTNNTRKIRLVTLEEKEAVLSQPKPIPDERLLLSLTDDLSSLLSETQKKNKQSKKATPSTVLPPAEPSNKPPATPIQEKTLLQVDSYDDLEDKGSVIMGLSSPRSRCSTISNALTPRSPAISSDEDDISVHSGSMEGSEKETKLSTLRKSNLKLRKRIHKLTEENKAYHVKLLQLEADNTSLKQSHESQLKELHESREIDVERERTKLEFVIKRAEHFKQKMQNKKNELERIEQTIAILKKELETEKVKFNEVILLKESEYSSNLKQLKQQHTEVLHREKLLHIDEVNKLKQDLESVHQLQLRQANQNAESEKNLLQDQFQKKEEALRNELEQKVEENQKLLIENTVLRKQLSQRTNCFARAPESWIAPKSKTTLLGGGQTSQNALQNTLARFLKQ